MKKFAYLFLFIFLLIPNFALADNLNNAFWTTTGEISNLDEAAGESGYDTIKDSPEGIISDIIGAFLSFLGVIFVILMIYGGYLWMTDRGNEDQVKKAKDLIASAIIGLLIVISAYAISYFVISYFSKGAIE